MIIMLNIPESEVASNKKLAAKSFTFDKLQHWLLHTPLGRDILRTERIFFHQNVGTLFGNYSLQIGLNQINFLHGNKIPNHYTLDVDLISDLRFLPIASNSIDLIVCPHVLEFTNNYHYILQEFSRILTPQGKLIITCFNRYSWFGLLKGRIPLIKKANLISLDKLSSQLQTLNLRIEGGKFFSYCPPFAKAKTLKKYNWLNKIGDRWLPTFANCFTIIASKEVITPTLIKAKDLEAFSALNSELGIGTAQVCNKN